jgi:serine/threonine protein kinase
MIKVCNDFYMDSNQKLGKGNYGTVYKGYKLSTNQIIAVKFLPSELVFRNKYYEREI